MSLGHSTQSRLDEARRTQLLYRPNDDIASKLREKTLAILVAPAACGKSYILQRVIEQDAECNRVVDITTREPRSDDQPGAFHYLPHDDKHVSEFLDKIDKRSMVQYAVHPTTGLLYGSELSGYPSAYNFLEALSNTVMYLRTLPFQRTIVIGVAVELAQWQEWFNMRFPEANAERVKRLEEAVMSLEWLTDPTHGGLVEWVKNGPTLDTASNIIDIVKGGSHSAYDGAHAAEMLAWARDERARSFASI